MRKPHQRKFFRFFCHIAQATLRGFDDFFLARIGFWGFVLTFFPAANQKGIKSSDKCFKSFPSSSNRWELFSFAAFLQSAVALEWHYRQGNMRIISSCRLSSCSHPFTSALMELKLSVLRINEFMFIRWIFNSRQKPWIGIKSKWLMEGCFFRVQRFIRWTFSRSASFHIKMFWLTFAPHNIKKLSSSYHPPQCLHFLLLPPKTKIEDFRFLSSYLLRAFLLLFNEISFFNKKGKERKKKLSAEKFLDSIQILGSRYVFMLPQPHTRSETKVCKIKFFSSHRRAEKNEPRYARDEALP